MRRATNPYRKATFLRLIIHKARSSSHACPITRPPSIIHHLSSIGNWNAFYVRASATERMDPPLVSSRVLE